MEFQICLIFLMSCCKIWAQQERSNLYLSQLETENFQVTKININEYKLSLTLQNSQRIETISLDALDGHVIVKGSFNSYYPDTMANLVVNYVADKNGYRASFRISTRVPVGSVSLQPRLSPSDLKSLVG